MLVLWVVSQKHRKWDGQAQINGMLIATEMCWEAEALWVRISVIEERGKVHRHGRWLRSEGRRTAGPEKLSDVLGVWMG